MACDLPGVSWPRSRRLLPALGAAILMITPCAVPASASDDTPAVERASMPARTQASIDSIPTAVTVNQLVDRLRAVEEMNQKLADELNRTRIEHREEMH